MGEGDSELATSFECIYVYKVRIDGVDVADPNNTLAGYADQPPYYLLVGQGRLEVRPGGRTEDEYYVGGNAHDWATWRHLLQAKLLPGLWRE